MSDISGYELQDAINSMNSNLSEHSAAYIKRFESKICKILTIRNGVAISSGPAAIHLALMALASIYISEGYSCRLNQI
jgi:dTDP-4-amino-4,6-dideoxygalactose transaminase